MASYDFEAGSTNRLADTQTRSYTTAHTAVALVTVESLPGAASYPRIVGWNSGTAARNFSIILDGDTGPGTLGCYVGATKIVPSTNMIPSTDGRWYLLGATKATGTVAVNFFAFDYSTGTWTEFASSGTVANRTASAVNPEIGAQAAAQYWDGKIAAVMTLTRALTLPEWRSLREGRMAWHAAHARAHDYAGVSGSIGSSPFVDLTTRLPTFPDIGMRIYPYATGTPGAFDPNPAPGW